MPSILFQSPPTSTLSPFRPSICYSICSSFCLFGPFSELQFPALMDAFHTSHGLSTLITLPIRNHCFHTQSSIASLSHPRPFPFRQVLVHLLPPRLRAPRSRLSVASAHISACIQALFTVSLPLPTGLFVYFALFCKSSRLELHHGVSRTSLGTTPSL